MLIGSVFLVLALALLVILAVTRPFWEKQRSSQPGGEGTSTLVAERERILEALLELDFDHQLGKIPDEDFSTLRASLVNEAAQVIKQLDTQALESGLPSLDVDDDLERLIAAHKADDGR
jgi:hypothetical protein